MPAHGGTHPPRPTPAIAARFPCRCVCPKRGHVVLPLIARRICRYDCGDKQKERERERERGATSEAKPSETDGQEEEPFRSCRGLRIAVTCLPQIPPSPKHVGSALPLFIYPFAPAPSSWSTLFIPRASTRRSSPSSSRAFPPFFPDVLLRDRSTDVTVGRNVPPP